MEPLSLGARLSRHLSEEKQNTRAAAEREALAQSEAALQAFQRVAHFFNTAKEFFTDGITAGTPSRKLFIMVGTPYREKGDNADIYQLLKLYDSANPPRITQPKHLYHSLWADFQAWAANNGLVPEWKYQYDGGGMSSWYELRVAPAQPAPYALDTALAQQDVRGNHAHCLSALRSTTEGLLDAVTALEDRPQSPSSRRALERLRPLAQFARQLRSQLNS